MTMKKLNINGGWFAVLFIVTFVFGCGKDDIMMYEQNPGVYFNYDQNSRPESKYSFFENPDKVIVGYDSIYVPLKINGLAVDYDRYVDVMVVDTSKKNTALPKMYSFGRGIIKANMYVGTFPIRINYTEELDESTRTVVLRIIPNSDFQVTDLRAVNALITFGNVAMQPENWNKLKTYFGDYSNSWYSFILRSTGRKSLPYKYYGGASQAPTPEEALKWPMTAAEVSAIAFQVKEILTEYNNTHPGEPLTHEDGEFKGQPVKMKI